MNKTGAKKYAVEMRAVDSIKPYARNPRKNDRAVDAVTRSIKEFGFRQPIVVDAEGVIIVGHTRWKAAKKLGLAEVPVHIATDLTEAQKKAYRIADNRIQDISIWDVDLLVPELSELKLEGINLENLGFLQEELASLLGGKEKDDETEIDLRTLGNVKCPKCGYEWEWNG
jgi:ParB-like chromosome segregation protein Spo0J